MSTQITFRVVAGSLLAMMAGLSGCMAPNFGSRPEMRATNTLASTQSIVGEVAAWPQSGWWKDYRDPALDALVDEALTNSPDVAVAVARIRQARGAAEVAGAAGLPQIGGQGNAGLNKQSYNNGVPADFVPKGWNSNGTLALSGDFNLDIWGKTRAGLAAATSQALAAEADAQQAALMLSSNVVSSYFDLARLIERDKALEEAVKARESVADLSRQRFDQGLDGETPVRQSQAAVASARIELAANREQIALRRHSLAALLGAGPDRGLAIAPTNISTVVATPVPADAGIALAGRRPDIVAARLRAEAAGKRIDVAKAAYMPDISLRGLIGLTSLGLSNLIDSGSTYGNAGAAISLPIFQGGRLSGQYTQARGGYDEAVAAYNDSVISALRDVADAIASRDTAEAQERNAQAARADADKAYDLATQRYRGGLASYLEVLSAQQSALAAREAAIDAHFRTLAREVALKRALGGGFAEEQNEKASLS